MQKYIFALESLTQCMKAKGLLEKHNIQSVVERTPKNLNLGCGYGIIVSADPMLIKEILEKAGIRIKKYSEVVKRD